LTDEIAGVDGIGEVDLEYLSDWSYALEDSEEED